MESKYKRVVVYDIETGGLSSKYNSLTEIAMVAVDLESLEIIEEMSVVFEPHIDLSWIGEPIKDAKTWALRMQRAILRPSNLKSIELH